MTPNLTLSIDASGVSDAAAELARLAREEIAPAAALIEDAFAGAARGIERELGRAAKTGELSLKGLARSIATELGRVAVDSLVRRPVESLLLSALTAPFGGGRAGGGPVSPGAAYLVGERGPELFTPSVPGRIGAVGGGGAVNVTIALPGVSDVAGFRASETQIAAGLARALARGGRNQ